MPPLRELIVPHVGELPNARHPQGMAHEPPAAELAEQARDGGRADELAMAVEDHDGVLGLGPVDAGGQLFGVVADQLERASLAQPGHRGLADAAIGIVDHDQHQPRIMVSGWPRE
jgi:hypothetical protein